MNKEQVGAKFTSYGSILALKSVHADRIDDDHLAKLWTRASQALGVFEMYEELIAEHLERPVS